MDADEGYARSTAMRDGYGGSAGSDPTDRAGLEPFEAFATLAASAGRTASAFLGAAGARNDAPGSAEEPRSTDRRAGDAILLLAQAHFAMITGGIRFLGRAGLSTAGFLGTVLSESSRLPRAEREAHLRLLLDEGLAQLRTMGDLSVQEARALQNVLDALSERLRSLEATRSEAPRRYARAKP